ncbi:MAG: hypothetical protein ACP5T0_10160 [Verrucomicrobiia bacterium]
MRVINPVAIFAIIFPLNAIVAQFDAAPYGIRLPDGSVGVMWEDPREIHIVKVRFKEDSSIPQDIRLEYWGSKWPHQRLPKDRVPGGGDVGWMELGNWYRYGWRTADASVKREQNVVTFTFNPVNQKEFPDVKDYPATFRYTLKIRIVSKEKLSEVEKIEAYTDSLVEPFAFKIAFAGKIPEKLKLTAFNGAVKNIERLSNGIVRAWIDKVANPDPNTYDKTLITIDTGERVVTFNTEDLQEGAIYIPFARLAVLEDSDKRNYAQVEADQKALKSKTLYDRVSELPEQTWRSAWESMPPKKSRIYFPLGLDGGRQRFRLNANGSIEFRTNDGFLQHRPGKDTPRLAQENAPVSLSFSLPDKPSFRTIDEESLPICRTEWDIAGIKISQIAFVASLDGEIDADSPAPPGDTFAVCMLKFAITNKTAEFKKFVLPLAYRSGNRQFPLTIQNNDIVFANKKPRFQLISGAQKEADGNLLKLNFDLAPAAGDTVVIKIPYLILNESELEQLRKLDFDRQHSSVAAYWRKRLNESANLITPEPMLNEFYRAHCGHLLINCEREPNSDRRFARVGSFSYGAYGNESCMMVVDLERRGLHKEAQECLDGWVHYQGSVGLPGDFSSKDGVLYGAGGYEAGGYNQHHGWILWMLAEHYRFTRDKEWLKSVAPAIIKGADWIIRETERTYNRGELERGLLPAGSLEDIGDWWVWLSTSCYTWRGLDNAAYALEQINHPEARRIRTAAKAYHNALTNNFTKAAQRSPVVRLRDGTAVPKFPSHVNRRGRSFGWICETLEGAIHLLITKAIDSKSIEAEWILKDYEDNLFLSRQWGYEISDFEKRWFNLGGMSMQACLLLDVEPYLYRDDIKQALRAMFNAQAVSYFPDVRLNTEHALPEPGDWRGDHYKTSDEANSAGWLRQIFVREQDDDTLFIGQAVPRVWLEPGKYCGIEKTATYFGKTSVLYTGMQDKIMCQLKAPTRNPPRQIKVRFRDPRQRPIRSATVNGEKWKNFSGDIVILPGNTGNVVIIAEF